MGTHERQTAGTGAFGGGAGGNAECGDHRQSVGEDDGKGGISGYDAGKKVKGRKRHVLVDTLGLVWGLLVTEADMPDREGALRLLLMLRGLVQRLQRIWADGGYRGEFIETVQRLCGWTVDIILRCDECKGFQILPKRWIVERTFAWLLNSRRLSKDYEYLLANSTSMIYAAMVRLMLRRLAIA